MESITQLKKIIKTARNNNIKSIVCEFTTIEKVALHPQEGIPLLYHDQLNIVAKHLEDIKLSEDEQNTVHQEYFEALQSTICNMKSTKKRAKLTRKILKKQEDWFEWQEAERKQLTQYEKTRNVFTASSNT